MKKIGIIGCGSISQVHAWVLSGMEDVKITAVCDIVKERASGLMDKYAVKDDADRDDGLPMEFMIEQNWRKLLEADLDAVHICTPHFLHVPMAVELLKAGKAVFMEKPCAISEYQLEMLKEADAEYPGKLGICFQNRYNFTTKTAAQLITEGAIGDLTGGRAFVTWRRDEDYYSGSPWKGDIDREGGGVLINQAIHTLDLLLCFLGKPERVESSVHNHHLKNRISVEDTVEAWMSFADGKRACFYASNGYTSDAPVILEIEGNKGRVTINGDEVLLRKEGYGTEIFTKKENSGIGKGYWGSGHRECIRDFYVSLEKGTRFAVDLESTENTFDVMMRIYGCR